MIWKAILTSICLLWTSTLEEHGVYISVFEIRHIDPDALTEKDKDYRPGYAKLNIKSFSDDVINALHNMENSVKFDEDPCDLFNQVKAYQEQHLRIVVNGQNVDLELMNCEQIGETHHLLLEFYLGNLEIQEVLIETDWMTEIYDNQVNVMKFNYFKKGSTPEMNFMKLDKKEKIARFAF